MLIMSTATRSPWRLESLAASWWGEKISPPNFRHHHGLLSLSKSRLSEMAELILGAVGLVPLIGLALNSSQTLWTELKAFRNCNNNVRRLHKKLKYQRQIFENECELLLRDCLGNEAEVQAMVADPNHVSWNSERDVSLHKLLKKNYGACWEHVNDINEALKKLETVLACFQAVTPHKQKVCSHHLIISYQADLETQGGENKRRLESP